MKLNRILCITLIGALAISVLSCDRSALEVVDPVMTSITISSPSATPTLDTTSGTIALSVEVATEGIAVFPTISVDLIELGTYAVTLTNVSGTATYANEVSFAWRPPIGTFSLPLTVSGASDVSGSSSIPVSISPVADYYLVKNAQVTGNATPGNDITIDLELQEFGNPSITAVAIDLSPISSSFSNSSEFIPGTPSGSTTPFSLTVTMPSNATIGTNLTPYVFDGLDGGIEFASTARAYATVVISNGT